MLPGPEIIIACPECGDLARRPTLASGNTFHAVQWSDGKLDAPMLPEYPELTRCRGCRKLYWLRDAPEAGELEPFHDYEGEDIPPAWLTAERADEPDLDEYADALEAAMTTDRDDERFLRTRYWWLYNDPHREQQQHEARGSRRQSKHLKRALQRAAAHAPRMEANLKQLAKLLDARKTHERLMKAEITRHLGRFDKAIALLEKCPARLRDYADQLLVFAKEGNRAVRPLVD